MTDRISHTYAPDARSFEQMDTDDAADVEAARRAVSDLPARPGTIR